VLLRQHLRTCQSDSGTQLAIDAVDVPKRHGLQVQKPVLNLHRKCVFVHLLPAPMAETLAAGCITEAVAIDRLAHMFVSSWNACTVIIGFIFLAIHHLFSQMQHLQVGHERSGC